ncbi:XRE family transcriptional regulator [Vibrio sp. 10N.261.51.A1]|uniref:XRE family transcriptional regulator n=1 Tax=unclassified Vibrio TaxID=2614977 RepID=UPI0035535546
MNTDLKELGILIGLARRHKDYRQKDLANDLGVTTQAVSYWESGRSKVSPRYANELAEILDLDIKLILDPSRIPKGRSFDVPILTYVELLFFTPKKERLDDYYLRDERIDIPKAVEQKIGNETLLFGVVVLGNIMEPVLKEGSIVVMDAKQASNIIDGAMYVVRHYDNIKIRLIYATGPQKKLICYNDSYVDEVIDSTDKNFTILGKVVWACSEF